MVRLAVSIGGDSDTIACIAGSIAEAYYGIPEDLKAQGLALLTEQSQELAEQLETFWKFCESCCREGAEPSSHYSKRGPKNRAASICLVPKLQ